MKPEDITRQSKSNFTLSFFFLSAKRKNAMVHFYAFSRVVDDAVDEHEAQEAQELIQFWKNEVRLCYTGRPTHPISIALQKSIQDFTIPQKYLDLIIEGCEQDIHKKRYATMDELRAYCYRVASVIGLVSMRIFGLVSETADKAAEELGLALQYTNILRDIKDDAQRDRIYIPQAELQRYKISESQIMSGQPSDKKLKLLLKIFADRAETHFQRAFTLLKQLPRRPLVAAWIMGKVYFAILKKIQKSHYDVYSQKIKISRHKKLFIAIKELFHAILKNKA